ncbi:MAG: M67 family metallopeptidase [Cyanobium sp.]
MISQTPEEIRAGLGLLTVLRRILVAAEPQEGCALLLGERLDEPFNQAWRLQRVWPCCNVWPMLQERSRRFAIDPREQLLAQKWGRVRGLELLGSAHSHPSGVAVPSSTDCRLSALPAMMVILGAGNQGLELVGWWIPEPPAPPQRLPWRMET